MGRMDNHTSLPSGGVGKQQKWKKARSRVKLKTKEKKQAEYVEITTYV